MEKLEQLELDFGNVGLQFLCFTETWVNVNLLKSFSLNNFSLGAEYCREDRGGGVAIFNRNCLNVRAIDLKDYCEDHIIEVCGVHVISPNPLLIVTCYRPPASNLNQFLMKLEHMLNSICGDSVYDVIFCGDFNIDSGSNGHDFQRIRSVFDSFNLEKVNNEPTRYCSSTATCLDHIYTNFQRHAVLTIPHFISDHEVLLLKFYSNFSTRKGNATHQYRNFSEANIRRFTNALLGEAWVEVYNCTNTNSAYNTFHSIFMYHFYESFPLQKTSKKITNRWVNLEVRQSSQSLRDLFIIQKQFPALRATYLRAKGEHTSLVSFTKRQFYQNKIFNSDNKVNATWQIINEYKSKEIKNNAGFNITKDNIQYKNPSDVANIFNNFFVYEARKAIPSQMSTSFNGGSISNMHSFYLEPCTAAEVYNIISNLKNKRSCGYDEVPDFILRFVGGFLAEPLAYVMNRSFEEGIFPDKLKMAIVVPIFKKGDSGSTSNYRPVSLLTVFHKIFEIAMYKRLMNFVARFNISSKSQHQTSYQSQSYQTQIKLPYNDSTK